MTVGDATLATSMSTSDKVLIAVLAFAALLIGASYWWSRTGAERYVVNNADELAMDDPAYAPYDAEGEDRSLDEAMAAQLRAVAAATMPTIDEAAEARIRKALLATAGRQPLNNRLSGSARDATALRQDRDQINADFDQALRTFRDGGAA